MEKKENSNAEDTNRRNKEERKIHKESNTRKQIT
jgi:hypothetical protein